MAGPSHRHGLPDSAAARAEWDELLASLSRIQHAAEERARAALGTRAAGRPAARRDRRTLSSIRKQREALAALRRSHEDLAKKVKALQEQRPPGPPGLLRWPFSAAALGAAAGSPLAVRAARRWRELEARELSAQIQKVTDALHAAQVAAYGQRGSVLKPNNLFLTANQLLWSFVEPLLRGLDVPAGARNAARWLAPVGSLVTGSLALANRQHIRFISGVMTIPRGVLVGTESLRNRVAERDWAAFQRRDDLVVTTVPLEPVPSEDVFFVQAKVEEGVLRIEITLGTELWGDLTDDGGPTKRHRIAWTVDLGPDIG